ncbi:S9 family peptidase [Micromonospora sp. HNM0581]|uniref:S9 family peptidase n=1 Tax=Micromonospora sp. HNM0581 TaxID=2716341 RepID=UPI00146AC118|nr:prolyl oligopeptidase family serine peptidase [Micromonospora sp. HNM0581]NLU78484.1 S9 family peptidase [Micromonospora sp. HNM0581]
MPDDTMPNDLVSLAAPPVAPTVRTVRELHGQRWTDEYAWMGDRDSPRLTAHLRAERRHYDDATSHLEDLRGALFAEVERRIPSTDSSVSWKRGDFFYYTQTIAGSEYGQFMSTRDPRQPGTVLLDEAQLTEPGGYVEIGVREISPNGRLLAYSVDNLGDEVYRLRFRDLTTLTDLPDSVPRTYYTGAWSADSATFFYTVHDDLFRPHQVWRHAVGTSTTEDVLVYTEDDPRYAVTVHTTHSGAYIMIQSACRDTTEVRLVPAADPTAPAAVVRPRRTGIEYRVDHAPETAELFIVTNDGAEEFQLMRAPVSATDDSDWRVALPARAGERLHACHVLADVLLLDLRRDGFPLLRIVDRATGAEREVTAGVPAGTVRLTRPVEYDADAITVQVESLVEPPAWYSVELSTGERTLRRRQTVGGYRPAAYRTERRHATAPDGTRVPYTLAWRADTPLDGTAPALLWGYGAYESCDDPAFDPMLPSLLDRGVVYALTHPRGGGENGRRWWLDGRLSRKTNTFTDHLAVADALAGDHPGGLPVVDGARIATRGLSAGGLLQAAVLAARPQRWRAVVAEVPFVDVVTTMLDPDIPLTANEWDEWGDPRQPAAFTWMRAYSPYDNPPGGPRPAMVVTGAIHDPRVMVHEPAKWVARLRATAKPDDGPLLFRVELGVGSHTGPAGRYAHLRYEAEILAFVLDLLVSDAGRPAVAIGRHGATGNADAAAADGESLRQ